MSMGVVMLVHTAFARVEQLIRHWVEGGCPVVVHVDRRTNRADFEQLQAAVADLPSVSFTRRYRCEWGTWGITAATQAAAEQILRLHPEISHVYLASGTCLPLRPVRELKAYLCARPRTDFIESATTTDVPWIVDGLSKERFILRFPFSWRRHRRAFDWYVRVQRRLKLQRKIPPGLVPHMGSQWWCLSRETLTAILTDPRRKEYDAYFRRVWIPDESYFQTLARLHSRRIESRSLTLSKFDFQGRPHIFYNDHLQLLRRSNCFVARKIWPHANRLWDTFLNAPESASGDTEPNPTRIERVFSKAVLRRTQGRPGLYMASRFPVEGREKGVTAGPYSVFEGFSELFPGFEPWLARHTGLRVHGHIFGPERAEFEGRHDTYAGALSANPRLRDYNANAFLYNLIWNTRGERQCFQFGPADCQDISWDIARDPNAQISVITGAWAIPLFQSNRSFSDLRAEAAKQQQIEAKHLHALRSPYAKARIRIWSLAEFAEAPGEALQALVDEIGLSGLPRPTSAPEMADLTGFGQFLQNLRNQGMHPYLMGDFPTAPSREAVPIKPRRKPYMVNR